MFRFLQFALVLLNRKYETKQARIVKYGSDSVAVVAKDVNRRFIAAFLALVFVVSCLIAGLNFFTKAEDSVPAFDMLTTTDKTGLILKKGLKDNGDGTYDLQMEAYATESSLSTETTQSPALDIIIVADRSTSMITQSISDGEGQDVSRLVAMKSAIESFAKEVARHANNENLNHRIAVMGPDAATDRTNGFVAANENASASLNSSLATVISEINSNPTASLADDLSKANELLKTNTSGSKPIIIVFTDGADSDEQNLMLAEAAIAKSEYGATIYSVGVPSPDTATNTFLSRVSSDYASSLTYTNSSNLNTANTYYFQQNSVWNTVSTKNKTTLSFWEKTVAEDGTHYNYTEYPNLASGNYYLSVYYRYRHFPPLQSENSNLGEEQGRTTTRPATNVQTFTNAYSRRDLLYGFSSMSSPGTRITQNPTEAAAGTKYQLGNFVQAYDWEYNLIGSDGPWISVSPTKSNTSTAYKALTDRYVTWEYRWYDAADTVIEASPDENTSANTDGVTLQHFYALTESNNASGYSFANASTTPDINNNVATIIKELQKTEKDISLNKNFVLKDLITDDFVVPQNPTVTVKTYSGTYNNGDEPTWGSETTNTMGNPAWSPSENGIMGNVSFNDKYISANHTAGEKIVITIEGLTLADAAKKRTGRIYSNEATSGIYRNAEGNTQELVTSFPRPYVDLTSNMSPAGESGDYDDVSGVVVNKRITPNANGNYDLTLEAYSTKKNEQITEKIPTDFILVVDQSGSMDTADMPAGYKKVSGTKTIEDIATGNYFIKSEDGNYYRVYGVRDYLYRYYPANYWFTGDIVEHLGADIGWFMSESDATTNIDNAFYYQEVVEGKKYYLPIKTTIEGKIGTYYMRFSYPSKIVGETYTFNREVTTHSTNGVSPWYKNVLNGDVMTSGTVWSAANAAVQLLYPNDEAYTYSTINLLLARPRTGMYINYPMYGRHLSYNKLCYRDINGIEHTLAATNGQSEWEFCDDNGYARSSQETNSARPQYDNLYEADGTTTRLAALKNAVTEFAKAVALEKDDYGPVDNKVSIVGFSSSGYSNTELLTHKERDIANRSTNGWQKGTCDGDASEYYGKGLVDSTNGTVGVVNPKITRAITAITANGGTQPEDGLNMAYQILTNRADKQYTIRSGARQGTPVDRNTMVIFFTDGQPGDYHESDQYSEANDVVEQAKAIKDYGSDLFSIGVFGESDGNPLTYADTSQKQADRQSWKYLGGWMETYYSGGTYYCLRRQWRPGNSEYTETANDTIYDYMSVVSSNYPNADEYIAPEWLSGNFNGNYIAATDGVRHKETALSTNSYYRMAANQETLVSAFKQAVTMTIDTIADQVQPDASAVLRDVLEKTTFTKSDSSTIKAETYIGTMDNNGVVTFDPDPEDSDMSYPGSLYFDSNDELVKGYVTGFNYMDNYIAYGKDAADGLQANQGRKLVVTITDVFPIDGAVSEGTTNVLSNDSSSALYGKYQGNETVIKEFRSPSITRHSYTLEVGDVNKDASFNVSATLMTSGSNPTEVDVNDPGVQDALEDVIVVMPNGDRAKFIDVGKQTFNGMRNGQSFYFENVPDGYQIQVALKATDEAYQYYLIDEAYDGQDMGRLLSMNEFVTKANPFSYDNHTFTVVSKASIKDVTIREKTIGSYANLDQVFDEVITMELPAGEESSGTITKEFDCTLSEGYHGFNDDTLPANADSYKAVFEGNKDGDKYVTILKEIISITGSVEKHYPIEDGKLPLKNGEEITLSVDAGNTVKVLEDDTHEHTVSYYYSQDDVKASSVKLAGLRDEAETYTLTFHPLESETSAVDMTVAFDGDGNITKVGGVNVDADTVLNLAPYGSVSSEDGLESVRLDVDGTQFYFMSEGSEENPKYVAYIKQFPQEPPCSVTVDKNNMDILILNERHDIPVEGIQDENDSGTILIIILAGVIIASGAGAGVFIWKKKDEFIEE